MFDEIVDAKPVGPFGSSWNEVRPETLDADNNQSSPQTTASDENMGSTSTPNTSMDVPPTPSTSMDTTFSIDLNFDIYGLRFQSVRENSSVVHCLWDDTEISHIELDQVHKIDEVSYFSAIISVELTHFEDKTCFRTASVAKYINYLSEFTELTLSHVDKGKFTLDIGKRHKKDLTKVTSRRKSNKVDYRADSFVYILGFLKVRYNSSVMCYSF